MSKGRPSPYRPDFAEQARKLCRNGATDREIADILGICVRTFYRWRAEHEAFAEALTAGKELADDRVERALYERACGYEYQGVKVVNPAGGKDPVIVPITVHVPADVGAAKQWLASRRPRPWAGEKEPEETDLSRQWRNALFRLEKERPQREAEERAQYARHIEAGVARELARRGLEVENPQNSQTENNMPGDQA